MSATLAQLQLWMATPTETEHLEFKTAATQFDFEKLLCYCGALANEGGGRLVLGVTNQPPRQVRGTRAFSNLEAVKTDLYQRLRFRVQVDELAHPNGRVLVFQIPSRPAGQPVRVDRIYWMRAGESLTEMSEDRLKAIFNETQKDFSREICPGATERHLDPAAVEEFRRRWVLKSRNKTLATLPSRQLIGDADLLSGDQITYAALVLLGTGEALGQFLPNAEVVFEYRSSEASIPAVAKFVAEHFKKNVQPLGYKAFLVAVDREACALYKKELDKLLPPEMSAPVYTSAHNDPEKLPLVAEYQLSDKAEESARKAFPKPGKDPHILIVTDKLLTGYDAPVLYCMYLDKPMRDHVLLQAIARVNRPYDDQNPDGADRSKPCGMIVDFVGILAKLKKALKFDSKDVSGVVENLDILFTDFIRRMTGPGRAYLDLTTGEMDDKAVEKAIDTFEDKIKRDEFYKFFKELEQIYEILSPDARLRDYIDDYRKLAIREQFDERQVSTKDALEKLELLAQEAIDAEKAKKESGLPDDTFAIYWELKRHVYKDPKKLAAALVEPFRRFPNFASNAEEMRQLKAELYKVLVPTVQGKKMVELSDRLIKVRSK